MITRAGSGFRAGHVVRAVDQQADPAELYEVNQRFTPPVPRAMTCRRPAGRLTVVSPLDPWRSRPQPGSVAGAAQYPAQVDNRLGVDVLMRGRFEEFGLRSDSSGDRAIVVLHDR